MGCTYSPMSYIQRRCSETAVEVNAWMSNYMPNQPIDAKLSSNCWLITTISHKGGGIWNSRQLHCLFIGLFRLFSIPAEVPATRTFYFREIRLFQPQSHGFESFRYLVVRHLTTGCPIRRHNKINLCMILLYHYLYLHDGVYMNANYLAMKSYIHI